MINIILDFFSNYLIEVMGVLLVLGLFFRAASYKLSKREDAYFSSFISEIEKALSALAHGGKEVKDVENYLKNCFDQSFLNKLEKIEKPKLMIFYIFH